VDSAPAVPTEAVWRITVEQYHQMVDSGILTEDDPVELLAGWLIYKMPKKPPHRVATKLTRDALEKLVPDGYYVTRCATKITVTQAGRTVRVQHCGG
jgi:hypothetical protein